MMTQNECLVQYVKAFNYKEVLFPQLNNKRSFIKKTAKGFIVIESLKESKIANFFFNDSTKIFKKSELLICAIENTPAAWE